MNQSVTNSFNAWIGDIVAQVRANLAPVLAEDVRGLLRENARVTFSEKEAAEILGMSERTLADIRRATRTSGKHPLYGAIYCYDKPGNDVRYGRHHLEAYLEKFDTMPAHIKDKVQNTSGRTLQLVKPSDVRKAG
jgi:AraC-like DNA-binding protein